MWQTSNMPTAVRVARCSSRIPVGYETGIAQPPKSTILAPSLTWFSYSGVRLIRRHPGRNASGLQAVGRAEVTNKGRPGNTAQTDPAAYSNHRGRCRELERKKGPSPGEFFR